MVKFNAQCSRRVANRLLHQAWDLLEGKTLFSARKEDGSLSDGAHFAELIAALGPPPAELLNRHRDRALEYWDEHGTCDVITPRKVLS